jgi:signal transduction histidine kinase
MSKAYRDRVWPESTSDLYLDLFDQIAESGIPPDAVEGLDALKAMSPEDRIRFLRFLARLIPVYSAMLYLTDTDDFIRGVYSGVLSNPMVKQVDVTLSVERVVRQVGTKLPTRLVALDVPAGLIAHVDRDALYIILANLLSNAIEAVREEGSPEGCVNLRAEMINADLLIRVSNPPPLIPLEIQQRMWNGGFSSKKSGEGRGLANVMRVARKAGVVVSYSGDSGVNVFTVTFPNAVKETETQLMGKRKRSQTE